MTKQKGSSTIGLIAIVAIALMVGIWIGSEKEIVISELEESVPAFSKTMMKKADNTEKAMMEKDSADMMMEKMEKSDDKMMMEKDSSHEGTMMKK